MLESKGFFLGIAVLVAACLLMGCGGEETEPEPDSATVEGVTIEFPRDTKAMPLSWRVVEEPPVVDPLPEQQVKAATEILRTAIAKYPDEFLPEHLTNVYVYTDMMFDGNGPTAAVCEEPSSAHLSYSVADPYWLEHMLHNLVAELLFLKYPELVEQVGFNYPITVPEEEFADTWMERDESFVKRGYLFPIAARSVGDDFSLVAAALMSGSRSAAQDAKDHPLIAEKMAKVKKFYLLLDKRFTEEYFQKIAENGHRGY